MTTSYSCDAFLGRHVHPRQQTEQWEKVHTTPPSVGTKRPGLPPIGAACNIERHLLTLVYKLLAWCRDSGRHRLVESTGAACRAPRTAWEYRFRRSFATPWLRSASRSPGSKGSLQHPRLVRTGRRERVRGAPIGPVAQPTSHVRYFRVLASVACRWIKVTSRK